MGDRCPQLITPYVVLLHAEGIFSPTLCIICLDIEEGIEVEIMVEPENNIILHPLNKPNEDLRNHLMGLLSTIKPGSSRHEEVDFGVEGDELI